MKKALGVNIILRNRPGAGGNIAWNLTWAAKPDGYTIATVNIPGAIVSELFGDPKPAYQLKKFFMARTDLIGTVRVGCRS